jgi:hypothetical protein
MTSTTLKKRLRNKMPTSCRSLIRTQHTLSNSSTKNTSGETEIAKDTVTKEIVNDITAKETASISLEKEIKEQNKKDIREQNKLTSRSKPITYTSPASTRISPSSSWKRKSASRLELTDSD